MKFTYPDGATPLDDISGLKPAWVRTQKDLNNIEAENISSAASKYLLRSVGPPQQWYLKNGLVSACLSTSEKAISGGIVSFLGNMEYFLVATPEFIKKNFSDKDQKKCLLSTAAIKFDKNDKLHEGT